MEREATEMPTWVPLQWWWFWWWGVVLLVVVVVVVGNDAVGQNRVPAAGLSTTTPGVAFWPSQELRSHSVAGEEGVGPDKLNVGGDYTIGGDYAEEDFENDELVAAFFDESDPLEVEFGPEEADALRHEKR
eukprot:scaffold43661_cov64-Attheya_sp.AAC.1